MKDNERYKIMTPDGKRVIREITLQELEKESEEEYRKIISGDYKSWCDHESRNDELFECLTISVEELQSVYYKLDDIEHTSFWVCMIAIFACAFGILGIIF